MTPLRSAVALSAVVAAAAPAFAAEEVDYALPALSLSFATSYIADEMGYWKDAGLAVKMPMLPGVGAVNAVLSGSVDFANASAPTLIRSNARGQKIVALATTVDRVLLEIVLAKPLADAAGITAASPTEAKARALRGKTMAVDSINSVVHAYLRYYARKGGVDPEREIVVTAVQPPAMLAGLKAGSLHGFTMSLPWTVIPVSGGSAVRLVSSPLSELPELTPFPYLVIMARPDTCEKKPTVCQRMVAGLAKAFAYFHERPAESLAILKKRLPQMDQTVLERSVELVRASTPKSPRTDEAALAKAQDFMIATGMMGEAERLAALKDVYTNTYSK